MSEPWRPHAGQKKAVKFLLEHAAAALLADPGVGKTSCVYAAFRFLKRRGLAERMLVVAPLRPARLVWPAEREKWKDFADLRVAVLHGKDKDALLYSNADVCVINFDGLDWLLDARRMETAKGRVSVTCDVKKFRAHGFDTLVIDELTQLKHKSSGRFKALEAVRDTFSRRWGLTGTPAPNGLIDLFAQALILDGGRTFGPYITHFRNQYFVRGYDGFSWDLRVGAQEQIHERMRPLALRLAAEDYVDMPALVENVMRFDLPDAAQKVYDRLEDELITQVEDHTVVAGNAAAASVKLRQVVSGGVYLEDLDGVIGKARTEVAGGRRFAQIHDAKTDLLEELVDGLQGTPLLVAYDFHHDLARIQKRFGPRVTVIGAGNSEKRDAEVEAAWNRGEVPILAGHPKSIGHGLNLQGAGNHVCWYSVPWERDLYDQLNGRVRRQGSRHQTVFVHLLCARGTIDEAIIGALRAKERVQTALLRALRDKGRKK